MQLIYLTFVLQGLALSEALAKDLHRCAELFLDIKKPLSPDRSQVAHLKVGELKNEFEMLARENPTRISVSNYGNVEGEDLIKVRVVPERAVNPVRVVIVGGIHGNEVLGSITALNFVRHLLSDEKLANRIDLTVYPMANPRALKNGQRKLNKDPELDLNRIFHAESKSPEVLALIKELGDQRFDIALDLHGAPRKEHFFAIGAADDHGLGRSALARLPQGILLESRTKAYPGTAGIDSQPDRYKLEARGLASSKLPNTAKTYFYEKLKTPYVYSLEYPGRMANEDALVYNEMMIRSFVLTLIENYPSNV